MKSVVMLSTESRTASTRSSCFGALVAGIVMEVYGEVSELEEGIVMVMTPEQMTEMRHKRWQV